MFRPVDFMAFGGGATLTLSISDTKPMRDGKMAYKIEFGNFVGLINFYFYFLHKKYCCLLLTFPVHLEVQHWWYNVTDASFTQWSSLHPPHLLHHLQSKVTPNWIKSSKHILQNQTCTVHHNHTLYRGTL